MQKALKGLVAFESKKKRKMLRYEHDGWVMGQGQRLK